MFPTAIDQNPTYEMVKMLLVKGHSQYTDVKNCRFTFTVREDLHPATEHGFEHCVLFG